MKVVLRPGDTLEVELDDTDGHFEIKYDVDLGKLEVTSDLPDTQGRVGVIYSEVFLSPRGRMIDALKNGEDPHLDTAEALDEDVALSRWKRAQSQAAAARRLAVTTGIPVIMVARDPNVPKPRTFYKTTYEVQVLHQEPIPAEWDLKDVLDECDDGAYSGDVLSQESVVVGPQTMRKLLIKQGSTPEFFDIANGDEIDFKDVVIERDGVRVTWTWIGEGVDGEFDFEHVSEGDEPRLRVDVVVLKNEHESDTFSYCTLAPTWTSREGLERMTNELVRRIYADPQNPRNAVEMWTHLTRPDPAEMDGGVE